MIAESIYNSGAADDSPERTSRESDAAQGQSDEPERKAMKTILFVICSAIAAAGAMSLLCGCAVPQPKPQPSQTGNTNGIPNLTLVEPGLWCSGQPDLPGITWLVTHGTTNFLKLDTSLEGDDSYAEALGAHVYRLPIDAMQQLVTGPDMAAVSAAVSRLGPGWIVHCKNGWDRSRLITGLYRLREGTNAAAAYAEMRAHGFHPALHGLQEFWDRASVTTNHQQQINPQ